MTICAFGQRQERPFSDPCSSLMFTVDLILNFQHDVWKLFEAWDQNHFFERKKDNELSNRYTIMGAHCLVGVYCSIFLEVTVTWKGDSHSHRRIWISNVMAGKLSDRFFFAFDLDFPEILSSNLFEQLAHTPKTIKTKAEEPWSSSNPSNTKIVDDVHSLLDRDHHHMVFLMRCQKT